MPVTDTDIDNFVETLIGLRRDARQYFDQSALFISKLSEQGHFRGYSAEGIWSLLDDDLKNKAASIQDRLKTLILRIVDAVKGSPLLSEADQTDLRTCMRRMAAALHFRRYSKWDAEVLHDEGVVLGVRPAGQVEEDADEDQASRAYFESQERVFEIINLLSPSGDGTKSIPSDSGSVRKYRPNTAFIMMWISDEHPDLEDVKNTFQEVFKQFGITAIRSDEIQHQDVITTRILEEIATSEFLIADLTGERPSVYYEVGYAHALGKRPILYRRKGTPLHFDLAVHNVPEYTNLTDLREKLHARLAAMTNKELRDVK